MSTVTIKNLPPDVHESLKSRARTHGRSLNSEILLTLRESVRSTRLDVDGVLSSAREVRETMPVWLTQKDLDAAKNEGRR